MNSRMQLLFIKGCLLWCIYLYFNSTRSVVSAFGSIVLRNRSSTCNRHLVQELQHGILGHGVEHYRGQRRWTSAPATAQETEGVDVTPTPSSPSSSSSKHSCTFCGKGFASRNALFRHLRNDEPCSSAAAASGGRIVDTSKTIYKRDTVVLLYSYDSFSSREVNYTEFSSGPTDIGLIEKCICDAFDQALQKEFSSVSSVTNQNEGEMGVVSCTQASVAKLRTNSLSQENGVSAAGDVMTLSYKYPIRRTMLDEKKSYQERHRAELFQSLKQSVNEYLSSKVENGLGSTPTYISHLQILAMKLLPPGTTFHAESSCTQRVYQYLLPIQWLTMGDQIEKWWTNTQNNEKKLEKGSSHSQNESQNEGRRDRNPRPEQLRMLKKVLRSFESREKGSDGNSGDSGNDNTDNKSGDSAESTYTKNFETSKWRFGLLANKLPKPWHNFCDRTMRGVHVSPNNKPVWRTLDRCRVVDFISFYDDNDADNDNGKPYVFAVVEFRGDDFIQQQVRKIMGTAIAVTNGWLPPNITSIATCQEVFVETPLAPPNHMYQNRPKFHYDELSNGGNSIFHGEVDEKAEIRLSKSLQQRIFHQWHSKQIIKDDIWIKQLKEEVAPRIREQLKNIEQEQQNLVDGDLPKTLRTTPIQYKETLSLLQDISSSGRWPTTSKARSKVIKNHDDDNTTSEDSKSKTNVNNNGSFTIINPKYMNGILMKEESSGIKKPLGNELFPELVDAVFTLEERLSSNMMIDDKNSGISTCSSTQKQQKRPPSSHCAINCNATFKPHIDSGRGYGQSLSMIVGLGNYSGGSLFVEGDAFDILYQPLEFDGWRDRHWTEQFQGERFSLVWFTPHLKGVNDVHE